mmetsp:Transcript_27743/g.60279  ORF Transcript_27743/g.60279 Transcript_27743/m.60279 type:complete len:113 (-) Transcript_27743:405-743(-)|eukprot:CAMPEP_0206475530 /NCGR_PEP_ID=MMETSP0324_2-20121206/34137_1 /ASSEMBLY_ACC=CAM_ASM_000836 /TAXON_ID=2866 /ORGANISM="Crypthecodinium cohnii, Strain Seligo" /LENGTH=112 /DNA_ID=CAMNT_0053950911 /DNA_START=105 /DNA_END=443 /DNA_ORIENTATION=+
MSLRLSFLRAMAAKAAPKPSVGRRAPKPQQQQAAPAPSVQPPPPSPTAYDAGAGGAGGGAAQGGGGGFGYNLLMIFGSIFGTILAFRLVSMLFGPRQIRVIHKDEHGNVISR